MRGVLPGNVDGGDYGGGGLVSDIQTTYDLGEALKELAVKYRVVIDADIKLYNGGKMVFKGDQSGNWTLR